MCVVWNNRVSFGAVDANPSFGMIKMFVWKDWENVVLMYLKGLDLLIS